MGENKVVNNENQYLLNRKLKVLIADDDKEMIDDILLNIDKENEDYEIVGYALSNEEERQKIEELKPDVVITDIFRGHFGNKNAGGYDIIKEYSEKYFVPKFIVLSYTPEFNADNIVGRYEKYPNTDYEAIKRELHCIKITERSSFMQGYVERKKKEEEKVEKKVTFLDKLKFLFQ